MDEGLPKGGRGGLLLGKNSQIIRYFFPERLPNDDGDSDDDGDNETLLRENDNIHDFPFLDTSGHGKSDEYVLGDAITSKEHFPLRADRRWREARREKFTH